ncbi:MAG: ABC transporter permease subunit [Mesorhizobium sp.]
MATSNPRLAVFPLLAAFRPGVGWLFLPGFAFLTVFFLWPTLQLVSVSLFDPDGSFSLAAFGQLAATPVYRRILLSTLGIAVEVTAWCLVLGYPLAYWISHQPKFRQRWLLLLVLMPFWTSSLVKNFAWLVLLGRHGPVSSLLNYLGLPGGGDLLFNRGTVVFAMVHTLLPLAIIIMFPALTAVNRGLISAARTLGASDAQAFWRVYFPLTVRGVATAGLLVFIVALAFFVTPALLGGPRQTMVGQLVIEQINTFQNWRMGSALAVILTLLTMAAVFLFDRVFSLSSIAGGGPARTSDTQTRKAGLGLVSALGSAFTVLARWRDTYAPFLSAGRVLSAYSCLIIALLLLPILAIIPMAFTSSAFLSFPPTGFSLRWFNEYWQSPLWRAATIRSFAIGLATASLTLAIATAAAFAAARSKGRISNLAFLLFMSPMIVPQLVIAIAMFYLFAQLSLVATNLGIVLGHTVISLPIVFVVMVSGFKGHDWRLDDAAATLGASRFQVVRRVTLPLVSVSLIVGFITGFLESFEELTIVMFVGGGFVTTLPKQLWDDVFLQVSPTLAAASVVILVIVTLLFLTMELLQRKKQPD